MKTIPARDNSFDRESQLKDDAQGQSPFVIRHFSPWPYAIVTYFIVFTAAMSVWTLYAVHQKMDLVRTDYYEEEMRYQKHLDRLNRTQPLRREVQVAYDASQQVITIQLPSAHVRPDMTGQIRLYRPSDANLDRHLPLQVNARGIQNLDAKSLHAGLWKVRVQWKAGGEEYFFDQPVTVGGI
jgi:hypothetical protein